MKYLHIIIVTILYFQLQVLKSQNCASLSGIINTYAPVSAISGNDVTIGASSGAAAPFAVGDYVVLIQMTGPPPVIAGSNMGKYELRTITGLSGSTITLDGIVNSYTTTEKVQLVRAPYCPTGTVNATITAKVWDGTTGGVIALKSNTLTLNADINATGTGFSQTHSPTTIISTSLSSGQGSTSGRGVNGDGTGSFATPGIGGGDGGGGIGGGGGLGGNGGGILGGNGGGIGGGGTGEAGLNGGIGTTTNSFGSAGGTGGGGGGGIIGGGGGGGGGIGYPAGGGGGGGVTGGGGGGDGYFSVGAGGGGGGVGGVGNGNSGVCTDACGGGGGGSYGGGGGVTSAISGGDDSAGGGGGGSWTGGGCGGIGGAIPAFPITSGGAGNTAVPTLIPDNAHYLNTTQPRLMMGGAGGNGSAGGDEIGGFGGGIVIMQVGTVNANNFGIISNGQNGDDGDNSTSTSAGQGGAGGGGGGQMALHVDIWSNANISVVGGQGGDGGSGTYHGGVSGSGGGGGGIWLKSTTVQSNAGGTVSITGVSALGSSGGINGASTLNTKNDIPTGTGACGGNGLVMASSGVPSWGALCAISLTSTPSSCNPANNQYSVTGSLTFSNAPTSGTLTVSIGAVTQTFNAPFTSPQAYTLSGLTSDGASHTVTAVFSADATCTNTSTYTAPIACQAGACTLSLTATPGACNPTNNQYSVTGSLTFSNAPASGTLTVSIGAVTQTFNAPFTSPQAYTLSGLTSDGVSHTATAVFSADVTCTGSVSYIAPIACNSSCPTTTYPICPGETYTITAQSGLTNYQWYSINGTDTTAIVGAINQTYTVTAIGKYMYRATDGSNCPIKLCCPFEIVTGNCNCTVSLTVAPTNCISTTNKYNLNGSVTFTENTGANLVVKLSTGDSVIISSPSSPQTYAFTGLTPTGNAVTVTAYFIGNTSCNNSTVYTSPLPCPYQAPPCAVVANVVVNGCNSNGTLGNAADDYFSITVSATATNPGGANKYVVAVGAINPVTGTGGNVLNPGGTTYGTAVVLGNTGQLVADGTSTFTIVVRDSQKRRCFQLISVGPVLPCSSEDKNCTPTLCTPIQVTKN